MIRLTQIELIHHNQTESQPRPECGSLVLSVVTRIVFCDTFQPKTWFSLATEIFSPAGMSVTQRFLSFHHYTGKTRLSMNILFGTEWMQPRNDIKVTLSGCWALHLPYCHLHVSQLSSESSSAINVSYQNMSKTSESTNLSLNKFEQNYIIKQ